MRFGAPSVRLFLVRLRLRRAELRFAGLCHCTRFTKTRPPPLTRSEVAIRVSQPRAGAEIDLRLFSRGTLHPALSRLADSRVEELRKRSLLCEREKAAPAARGKFKRTIAAFRGERNDVIDSIYRQLSNPGNALPAKTPGCLGGRFLLRRGRFVALARLPSSGLRAPAESYSSPSCLAAAASPFRLDFVLPIAT